VWLFRRGRRVRAKAQAAALASVPSLFSSTAAVQQWSAGGTRDCSAAVLDGVWPYELIQPRPETEQMSRYLHDDLMRIVARANEELAALAMQVGTPPEQRIAEEVRLVNVARAMAVLRVESTVRQMGRRSLLASPDVGTRRAVQSERVHQQPPPPPSPTPEPVGQPVHQNNVAPAVVPPEVRRSRHAARHDTEVIAAVVADSVGPVAVAGTAEVQAGEPWLNGAVEHAQGGGAEDATSSPGPAAEGQRSTESLSDAQIVDTTTAPSPPAVVRPQPRPEPPPASPAPEPVAAPPQHRAPPPPRHRPSPPPPQQALPAQVDLRAVLGVLARQQPALNWLAGRQADGSTVIMTDVASGWIPPGIVVPASVVVLAPAQRSGHMRDWEPLQPSLRYGPGDRIEGRVPVGKAVEAPFAVVEIDDLANRLAEETRGSQQLAPLAHELAAARAAGVEVLDAEREVLAVYVETAVQSMLAQYPSVSESDAVSCMLLAAAEALAAGRDVLAAYHYGWYESLAGRR